MCSFRNAYEDEVDMIYAPHGIILDLVVYVLWLFQFEYEKLLFLDKSLSTTNNNLHLALYTVHWVSSEFHHNNVVQVFLKNYFEVPNSFISISFWFTYVPIHYNAMIPQGYMAWIWCGICCSCKIFSPQNP